MAYRQVQITSSWQQFQLSGIVPNNANTIIWLIGGNGTVTSGQSFFMWNPMVEDMGTAGTSITNVLPYSQRFSTWAQYNATATDNAGSAPDGSQTASLFTAAQNTGDAGIVDNIANPAQFSGVPVTASVWMRSASGTQPVLLTFLEMSSSGQSLGTLGFLTATATPSWQRFQVTGTTQNALSVLQVQIGGAGTITNGQSVSLWGAQVELASSAGPYVPTGATPATIGTTMTNLLPFSQNQSGSTWSATGATRGAYSSAAPDGSLTATQITGTVSDSFLGDSVLNPALYDGQTITASIYLRSLSGTQNVNLYVPYDNASGTHYLTPQTASLTTTWQRFEITGTVGTGLTGLRLQIGGGSSVGSGQGFAMWGPQMEIASHAGPYVATAALPVITGATLINAAPNAQQVNSPSWGIPSQTSVAVNADTAPDGANTAAVVSANGANPWLILGIPNPSLYDQQTVTASVYLRSTTGATSTQFMILQNGNENLNENVTLGSNWQRYQLTGTLQNGLTGLGILLGGGDTFANGPSFEMWGLQFVVGSSPGTYTGGGTGSIDNGGTGTNILTGQSATLAPYGLNETYAYDSFGNILQIGGFNATYTANNQMFGYAYDAAGNLLSDGVHGPMTWDAESRISSASGATYIYDAEGNRVEKQGVGVTDTVYFGGKPIARLSAGQWTDLIYGPNGLLAEVPGTQTAQPTYRLLDHLGTEIGQTDATQQMLNPLDYTPFGRIFTGNTNDPYLFTGKERDQESGLDYFGARYYGSGMGRFMSSDSSGYSGLTNPQSWNLYAYTLNNPLKFTDQTGHNVIVDCSDTEACRRAVADATGNHEAAQRVRLETVKKDHSFLGHHWTTNQTNISISGDMASFRALSSNASHLADLVASSNNYTVDINNSYYADDRQTTSGFLNHTVLNPDFTQTPSITGSSNGNVYVRWDPGRYDQEARDENIPTVNFGEAMAHELLGHLWGEVFGGHINGSAANKQDAVNAENEVRATDPSRGQKAAHDHGQIQY